MLSLNPIFLGIGDLDPLAAVDGDGYKLLAINDSDDARAVSVSEMLTARPLIVAVDVSGMLPFSLYYRAAGGWLPARADGLTTGVDRLVAVVVDTGMLLGGLVTNPEWDFEPGQMLYMDVTTNLITATRPSASGHVVRPVGHAVTDTSILFAPSPHFIEIK